MNNKSGDSKQFKSGKSTEKTQKQLEDRKIFRREG